MWFTYSWRKMVELFANSGESDQILPVASDLGLHCLPITHLGFPDYNLLTYHVWSRLCFLSTDLLSELLLSILPARKYLSAFDIFWKVVFSMALYTEKKTCKFLS